MLMLLWHVLSSVPCTYTDHHTTTCNSTTKRSDSFFWPRINLHIYRDFYFFLKGKEERGKRKEVYALGECDLKGAVSSGSRTPHFMVVVNDRDNYSQIKEWKVREFQAISRTVYCLFLDLYRFHDCAHTTDA